MSATVPTISVASLALRLSGEMQDVPQLIDVRDEDEWRLARIEGAQPFPLNLFPEIAERLDPQGHYVVYCHKGARSAKAVEMLMKMGFTNVASLSGGIDAWSVEVDSSVPRY